MHKLGFPVSSAYLPKSIIISLRIACTRSMGFARLAESTIRKIRGKTEGQNLSAVDKIIASSVGGALATWNQPIEVVRVEVRVPAPFPLTSSLIASFTFWQ